VLLGEDVHDVGRASSRARKRRAKGIDPIGVRRVVRQARSAAREPASHRRF